MRTSPSPFAPFLLIVLASCSVGTPEPSAASFPDPPAGWSTITSDAGDVTLLVPPDFQAVFTADGVLAQPAVEGGTPRLEILALGPGSVVPQPMGGESLRGWVENNGWVPTAGMDGVTTVGDLTERKVLLASGRALEVAVTVQPDMSEASRIVVYAVQTDAGFAIMRFIGFPPQRLHDRAEELEIVAQLARFGAAAGD